MCRPSYSANDTEVTDTVPYTDTVLLMPTTMCTAAVEHCVGRGNGSMLVTGVKMAQQPERVIARAVANREWILSGTKSEASALHGGRLTHVLSRMAVVHF